MLTIFIPKTSCLASRFTDLHGGAPRCRAPQAPVIHVLMRTHSWSILIGNRQIRKKRGWNFTSDWHRTTSRPSRSPMPFLRGLCAP